MITVGSIFAIFIIQSDKIFGPYINFIAGFSIIALLYVSFFLRVLEIKKYDRASFSDNSIFHNSRMYIILNGYFIVLSINTSIILLITSLFIEITRSFVDESVIIRTCEEITICQYIILLEIGGDKRLAIAKIMEFYFFLSIMVFFIGYIRFLILLFTIKASDIPIDEYNLFVNFRTLLITIALFLISMIILSTFIDEYYFRNVLFLHENYSSRSLPFFIKLWGISTIASIFLYALFAQFTTFAFLVIRRDWSMSNE